MTRFGFHKGFTLVELMLVIAIIASLAAVSGCATDAPIVNIDREAGQEIAQALRDDALWLGAYGFATAEPRYLAEMQAVCAAIEGGTAEVLQALIEEKIAEHAGVLQGRPALRSRIAGMAGRYGFLIDFDALTVTQAGQLAPERFQALTTTLCDAVRAAGADTTG